MGSTIRNIGEFGLGFNLSPYNGGILCLQKIRVVVETRRAFLREVPSPSRLQGKEQFYNQAGRGPSRADENAKLPTSFVTLCPIRNILAQQKRGNYPRLHYPVSQMHLHSTWIAG